MLPKWIINFLDPKIVLWGSKSIGPLKKPFEKIDYVFCSNKKITSRTFRISCTLLVTIACPFLLKSRLGNVFYATVV
jgi:hypothetical protein